MSIQVVTVLVAF